MARGKRYIDKPHPMTEQVPMSWEEMRLFHDVYQLITEEKKTIAEAAIALSERGLGDIDLHKWIDKIEDAIGGENGHLFLRHASNKRVRATEAARDLYFTVRYIVTIVNKQISAITNPTRFRLLIGCTGSIASFVLPDLLSSVGFFHESENTFDLRLKEMQGKGAEEMVMNNEVDFALGPNAGVQHTTSCTMYPLFKLKRGLLYHKDHKRAHDIAAAEEAWKKSDVKYPAEQMKRLLIELAKEVLMIPQRNIMSGFDELLVEPVQKGRRFKLFSLSLMRIWVRRKLGIGICYPHLFHNDEVKFIDLSPILGDTEIALYHLGSQEKEAVRKPAHKWIDKIVKHYQVESGSVSSPIEPLRIRRKRSGRTIGQ